jgi:hypothetical protein
MLGAMAREVGQTVEREVHFARAAAQLVALDLCCELAVQVLLAHEAHEGAPRVEPRHHRACADLVAVVEHDAGRAPPRHAQVAHRRLGQDLGAEAARRRGDRLADAAGAAFREPPRAKRAVDLAHVMVEQHVGGAGRAHAQEGADDAAHRHRRHQRLALEPLLEEIHRTHRHELEVQVAQIGLEIAHEASHPQQLQELARIERGGIGRRLVDHVLGEARQLAHRQAELGIDVGVARAQRGDLAMGAVRIAPARERASVG